MQGKIIHYSEATRKGLISGEDGLRYSFQLSAWMEKKPPQPGMRVGFQCKDKERGKDKEREVFCVCPIL